MACSRSSSPSPCSGTSTPGRLLIIPEFTTDLLTWTEADIIMFDAVNQGDGTELISWRTTLPAFDPAKDRCFMRLRIEGK